MAVGKWRQGCEASVRHGIVTDEAPVVIGWDSKTDRRVVRMPREVRRLGEGLALVCSNPATNGDIRR